MMMKKHCKSIIILTVCPLLLSCCAKKSNSDEEKQTKDKYTFNYNSDCRFTSDNSISKSGDFVYLAPLIGGLYEYDTQTEKLIELPEPAGFDGGAFISDLQLYDGKLFNSSWSIVGSSPTKFTLLNLNTGEYESLYSTDSGQGAEYAQISEDGYLFYCTNLFGDNDSDSVLNHVNEDGYDVIFSLVQYDINTKETKTLVDGVNHYYFSGDRIYFDRINRSEDTVRLYYTDFDAIEKGQEPIDTGVDVGSYNAYMWTVRDGLVYFADDGDDKALKTYDTETKEIKEVFSSDMGIRTFGFMGDYIVFWSRFPDETNWYLSQLSIYNTKTKEETLVMQEERDFSEKLSERPSGFIVSDDLDYFIMETQNTNMDTRYYKVTADGSKELILEKYQNPEEEEGEEGSESSTDSSNSTVETALDSISDSGE